MLIELKSATTLLMESLKKVRMVQVALRLLQRLLIEQTKILQNIPQNQNQNHIFTWGFGVLGFWGFGYAIWHAIWGPGYAI